MMKKIFRRALLEQLLGREKVAEILDGPPNRWVGVEDGVWLWIPALWSAYVAFRKSKPPHDFCADHLGSCQSCSRTVRLFNSREEDFLLSLEFLVGHTDVIRSYVRRCIDIGVTQARFDYRRAAGI